MPDYRRAWHPGATYFFTVNTLRRRGCTLLTDHIDSLRAAVRTVRRAHPFRIHGWVVLPDHLHAVIDLPPGDADFATRWRLIKAGFSRRLPATERRSAVRVARGERGIWQRRFWKHLIRDERDFAAHMDYVHFNPVKHGHVARVADWPYSTFHALVAEGIYPAGWAGSMGEQGGHILICEFPPLNAAQCASLIAPYREQALSTRLVTQIDIHRLHRLTQINAD